MDVSWVLQIHIALLLPFLALYLWLFILTLLLPALAVPELGLSLQWDLAKSL